MALIDGLNLLSKAAALTKKPTRPSTWWAHVYSTSPLSITLDDDPNRTPLEVAVNALGPLQVGWAVLVQIAGGRITILESASLITAIQERLTTLERSASGFTAFTLSAVDSATIGVSFPAGRFLPSDQLIVHVSKGGGQLAKFVPYCNAISATGMTLGLYSGDGSVGTGNVNVFWTVELRRP